MVFQNYTLVKKEWIQELKTTGYLFVHNKTKAKIMYLSNEDDNKVFFIGFRTPAPNNTGLPHILEHSVLCGSRKFPIKDPFMEMVKGSLQTFINAMTFPDKTLYPIASRNNKDFINLVNVYMDAVLHPRIASQPEILQQEGWHYQLSNKKDTPTISGVVYNEMKGAFSSPESVLSREILHTLFPDTNYRNESGGIPECIPNLTQEEFVAFHKKYYHPSNGYIFFYGNGDIEEHLQFIDQEYLHEFDYVAPDPPIQLQKPFQERQEKQSFYPLSKEDSPQDKAYLSLSFVVGVSYDPVNIITLEILSYLLLDSEAAPLKKALLDQGIGKDIFGSVETDVYQPVFSIFAKNTNKSQKEVFIKTIQDTLQDLVTNGIEKELIQGAINSREFSLREADFGGYPRGLVYGIAYVMSSWHYDQNPFVPLQYENILTEIKKSLKTRYFEDFIQHNLLSNPHSCLVILEPEPGLNEKKETIFLSEMEAYKSSLDDAQLDALIENNRSLEKFQTKPDAEIDLDTIPMLNRSDLVQDIEILPLSEQVWGDLKVHYHEVDTKGILYQTLFFPLHHITQENLKWVGLLLDVIGRMDTKKYTYGDLENQINIHTGGIQHSSFVVPSFHQPENWRSYVTASTKVLPGKIDFANTLLLETLHETIFSNRKRLLEIIQETLSRIEINFLRSGHSVTMNRIQSYWSPSAYLMEELEGINYYYFLKDIETNFHRDSEMILSALEKVKNQLFQTKPELISITSENTLKSQGENGVKWLSTHFQTKTPVSAQWNFPLQIKNEGFITPSNVQYVAKGYNYRSVGIPYQGQLNVLRTIITHNYLYENIRVLGGAYGAFSVFRREGSALFASYRDPNLANTLTVYDKMSEYISSFQDSEKNFTKLIVGTMGTMNPPLSPSKKGAIATMNYLAGLTDQDRRQEKKQALYTTQEEIRSYKTLIEEVMKQNAICVLGSESVIKENQNLFKTTIQLL